MPTRIFIPEPCVCGFSGVGFSSPVARARAHRVVHLAAFPALDRVSRQNLDFLVECAERVQHREREAVA